jgi:cyclopropane fatty-acyl-phospholipid synthase-like methyltransferase
VSRDERESLQHFRGRYAVPASDVGTTIEEHVIGASWGANGYTTRAQADELARRLGLEKGHRVLDVGTGRGWPGLYYATAYGCRVVGSDMPLEALTLASARAAREDGGERFCVVAAAGARQPFRPQSFDAVVHTDVLC